MFLQKFWKSLNRSGVWSWSGLPRGLRNGVEGGRGQVLEWSSGEVSFWVGLVVVLDVVLEWSSAGFQLVFVAPPFTFSSLTGWGIRWHH